MMGILERVYRSVKDPEEAVRRAVQECEWRRTSAGLKRRS